MQKFFIFILPLFIFTNDFTLKKEKDGIKVWLKNENKFYRFKVQMHIFKSAVEIEKVLQDYSAYTTWNPKLKEIKVLKKTENQTILYMRFSSPWPFEDRDQVVSVTKEIVNLNSIFYLIKSDTYKVDLVKNVVRINQVEGFWHLEKLQNNSIQITQEIYSDPKVNLPKIFAQNNIVNLSLKSFQNLKNRL